MKVSLFTTCVADQLYPRVAASVVAVLERYGCSVDVPASAVCCGQPAFNAGFSEDARKVARALLDALEGRDHVVVPSGSCGAMIRHHFPALFAGTPQHRAATALAQRVYEFSQFLVAVLGVERLDGSFPHRVTYHPSCHGSRLLGVRDEPLVLLRSLGDIDLVPLERAEDCCGFGGTFAIKLSQLSSAIADEKIEHVLDTGARFLASTDLGCLMHLSGRMKKRGEDVEPLHVAEIIDRALSPEGAWAREPRGSGSTGVA